MNFKTIPVAAALLGAVSLSSFAIAATDNVDTAAVRGFDTVASRPAAEILNKYQNQYRNDGAKNPELLKSGKLPRLFPPHLNC